MKVEKSNINGFNSGKNPDVINKSNVFAFISTDTSFKDFLTTIRMIRLTEEEKVVYELMLKKQKCAAISAKLNISKLIAEKLIKSVCRKLKLELSAHIF